MKTYARLKREQTSHKRLNRTLTPAMSGSGFQLQRLRIRSVLEANMPASFYNTPGSALKSVSSAPVTIQRIPAPPTGVPFNGETTPTSSVLRSSPKKPKTNPKSNIVTYLPKGQKVRVLGGTSWVFIKTHVGGLDRSGYVWHTLLKTSVATATGKFVTNTGKPISTGGTDAVPPLSYEISWMKKRKPDE